MSRIAQALDAFSALLATLSGVTVKDNLDIPVDFIAESGPHLNVIDADDEEGSPVVQSQIAEHRVGVVVEGYVTRNAYADLRAAREALFEDVWNLIMGTPRLLDGSDELTWNVVPGRVERERYTERKKPTAVFRLPVTLCVNTKATDLSVAA